MEELAGRVCCIPVNDEKFKSDNADDGDTANILN